MGKLGSCGHLVGHEGQQLRQAPPCRQQRPRSGQAWSWRIRSEGAPSQTRRFPCRMRWRQRPGSALCRSSWLRCWPQPNGYCTRAGALHSTSLAWYGASAVLRCMVQVLTNSMAAWLGCRGAAHLFQMKVRYCCTFMVMALRLGSTSRDVLDAGSILSTLK